ncbi:hypothetical protein [Streptomyces sp. NPDC046759]|uniref:hypothetical protein n=1 Tax=Streptomyces sp. NPDC046759 TaxID=3155019 RepID=UPI0033DBCAAF
MAQRLQAVGFTDVLEGTVYPALARHEREGLAAGHPARGLFQWSRTQVLPADRCRP